MSLSKILNTILVLTVVILGVICVKSCHRIKNDEQNLYALSDTLVTYRNKDSSQTAKIASFQADKLSDLLKIKSSDSSVKRLQSLIRSNPKASSAIVVSTSTGINTTTVNTITRYDTVDNKVYPVYESHIQLQKWITGTSIATKDSTHLDLRIENDYDVVIKKESGKLNAYVINHNPYTTTTMLRAATLSAPAQKRFGIGPSAGVTYYNGKIHPYIGIGVNFNIIKF